MKRKVLITGATGSTGSAAVTEAIKRGLDVRAMVHGIDDRSGSLKEQGADVVPGDLHDINTLRQAMENVDAAYLVYPVVPGLIEAAVSFAQAAKEAGVSALVFLSQKSASRTSESHACRDNWIAEQVLNWSGLPVTHLRPTYFLEWLLYPWQLPLIRDKGILRMPVGNGRHAAIAAEDIGRVVAAILETPAEHAGQTYPLFGPVEMDHSGMAHELSLVLKRKIVFEDIAIETYCKWLETLGVSAYRVQHFSGAMDDYQHGVMSGMNDNVERLSGRKPVSLRDFAFAHVAELNATQSTNSIQLQEKTT